MKWGNSFLVAFGMYSRIPVPQADWEHSSMEYVMCFFPFIGTVTGVLVWFCRVLGQEAGIHPLLLAAVLTVLPLWISGGIHMDGYMDTKDALATWGDKEKKLAVLKDSRTGAFAVLGCGVYLLLSFGSWCAVVPGKGLFCICLGYMVSRTLSGLSVLCFPKAKKTDSYVSFFAMKAQTRKAVLVLAVLLAAEWAALVLLGGPRGCLVLGVSTAVYGWYYYISKKEFGGITGDLAGYFVQLLELAVLFVMAVVQ